MNGDGTPTSGLPFPLGATLLADGANFAIVADGAPSGESDGAVILSLLDGSGAERHIPMEQRTAGVWHTFVPGVVAGQRYGYRVAAHDRSKLLLDPYARQVDRTDYDLAAAGTPGADTAGLVPVGIVTAAREPAAAGPQVPWEHTVIYEAHVKGMTKLHPEIPSQLRGTYAGLAHPAAIDHLVKLGITTVELLPVHAHAAEPLLAAAGRSNYWGYSTLNYFALHPGYASTPGDEIAEFAHMVDTLHRAGLEVVLDVVYNHTCEGGPTDAIALSWRGLSEQYYLPDDRDLTGTGNTIDAAPLATVRMVTDSLRYFATEFGVDGFRFDLAPVLGRPGGGGFDAEATLLSAIAADPILRTRKLIAEPWDATAEGYALGRFGTDWAEWNDRFRGTVRDFWRGTGAVRELAYRLAGSEDFFADRAPWASINFVTAHDGFTLRDLVSYERKHNAANGQGGVDGTDDNRSANYGVEGDGDVDHPLTDDIRAVRARQARNLAATLLLATGTPMMCAGDEMWRTQLGNNNAYTVDSQDSWLDWSAIQEGGAAADLLAFFRRTIALRTAAPALHQGNFFSGRSPMDGDGVADLKWFTETGAPMTDATWFEDSRRTLMMWFDGNDVRGHGLHGEALTDDSWLIVLHASTADTTITLPGLPYGDSYLPVLDTDSPDGVPRSAEPLACGCPVPMPARTVWLLRANRPEVR